MECRFDPSTSTHSFKLLAGLLDWKAFFRSLSLLSDTKRLARLPLYAAGTGRLEVVFRPFKQVTDMSHPDEAGLDLDAIYAFAIQLGKDAGAMLMEGARARMAGGGDGGGIEEKDSAVDIVTKVDEGRSSFPLSRSGAERKADAGLDAVARRRGFHSNVHSAEVSGPQVRSSPLLSRNLPDAHADNGVFHGRFVGEESYSKGASKDYLITDEPTWCVDPLDGTPTHLLHHLFD